MSKYIDAEKLKTEIDDIIEMAEERWDNEQVTGVKKLRDLLYNKIASLQQEQDMGEVSDDYHTFNELYYYRMLYNAAFFNLLPKALVHKSKRHHSGEECFGGGWFIVMANLPTGQVSNHYELKDWDLFKIPEKEFADEWDGHTPQEAAERLHKYLQQEKPKKRLIQVKCLYPYDESWKKNKVYTCEVWHHGYLNRDFWDVYYDYGKDPRYVQFPSIELLNEEFVVIQEQPEDDLEKIEKASYKVFPVKKKFGVEKIKYPDREDENFSKREIWKDGVIWAIHSLGINAKKEE